MFQSALTLQGIAFINVEANYLGGSSPRKGDLLVIAGATLYAVSNVSEVSVSNTCEKDASIFPVTKLVFELILSLLNVVKTKKNGLV